MNILEYIIFINNISSQIKILSDQLSTIDNPVGRPVCQFDHGC